MADLHRTFIAVDLNATLRAAVVTLERDLEAAGARLKWIKPANLHFTLKFLGEVSTAQVARARIAARETAAAAQPFRIHLASLGAFPTLQKPEVVWVGVGEGKDDLEALAAGLEQQLARQRFPLDRRRFRPHLTLARIRDVRTWGDIVRALERLRDVSVGGQVIDTLTVYESRLSPKGSSYTALEEVPLGVH
ncbi:MAG TPA: RNA 2',3'-cyclic phosphodiesterase [bacterium]|jgi:2'-5' RNA ligase|nr:RNA 2',3'-cyclic phosphodiesterase [bacterium]